MDARVTGNERRKRIGLVLALLAFWAGCSVLMFSWAMFQPFSHDENQFVAAGALIAREGLVPYRDFPLHHTPYQPLIYSVFLRMSDHLLLVARAVSSLSGMLSLGILLYLSWRAFRPLGLRAAGLAVLGSGLLFVTSPIVAYTSGRAWNHDLPLLFGLSAFGLRYMADSRAAPYRWLLASGISCGLALGTRLSFAALAIPLLLSSFMGPARGSGRQGVSNLGAIVSGLVIGVLPIAVLVFLGPSGFYFGNVVYQVLNTVYRELLFHWLGNALGGKLVYLREELLPNPALASLLLASVGLCLVTAVKFRRARRRLPAAIPLAVGFWVLLAAGSVVPTPLWYQYFYAPIPFLILALVFSAATLMELAPRGLLPPMIFASAALVSVVAGSNRMTTLSGLADPSSWIPIRVHQAGVEMASWIGEGQVLTLAPIVPLEGGLRIYKAFAAGPFTWRVAHLLSPERRVRYGVISIEDLRAYLDSDPPAAIATGFESRNEGFVRGEEGGVEEPLITYATENGYTPIPLDFDFAPNVITVWRR